MKRAAILGLIVTLASLGFAIADEIQPADAHTVRSCAVRTVRGSYNYTWASDTYDNHSSPTNCEIQARLKRRVTGRDTYYYGSWGIIKSYIYTNRDSANYVSGQRNCGRIKIPSTGYRSGWACIN